MTFNKAFQAMICTSLVTLLLSCQTNELAELTSHPDELLARTDANQQPTYDDIDQNTPAPTGLSMTLVGSSKLDASTYATDADFAYGNITNDSIERTPASSLSEFEDGDLSFKSNVVAAGDVQVIAADDESLAYMEGSAARVLRKVKIENSDETCLFVDAQDGAGNITNRYQGSVADGIFAILYNPVSGDVAVHTYAAPCSAGGSAINAKSISPTNTLTPGSPRGGGPLPPSGGIGDRTNPLCILRVVYSQNQPEFRTDDDITLETGLNSPIDGTRMEFANVTANIGGTPLDTCQTGMAFTLANGVGSTGSLFMEQRRPTAGQEWGTFAKVELRASGCENIDPTQVNCDLKGANVSNYSHDMVLDADSMYQVFSDDTTPNYVMELDQGDPDGNGYLNGSFCPTHDLGDDALGGGVESKMQSTDAIILRSSLNDDAQAVAFIGPNPDFFGINEIGISAVRRNDNLPPVKLRAGINIYDDSACNRPGFEEVGNLVFRATDGSALLPVAVLDAGDGKIAADNAVQVYGLQFASEFDLNGDQLSDLAVLSCNNKDVLPNDPRYPGVQLAVGFINQGRDSAGPGLDEYRVELDMEQYLPGINAGLQSLDTAAKCDTLRAETNVNQLLIFAARFADMSVGFPNTDKNVATRLDINAYDKKLSYGQNILMALDPNAPDRRWTVFDNSAYTNQASTTRRIVGAISYVGGVKTWANIRANQTAFYFDRIGENKFAEYDKQSDSMKDITALQTAQLQSTSFADGGLIPINHRDPVTRIETVHYTFVSQAPNTADYNDPGAVNASTLE